LSDQSCTYEDLASADLQSVRMAIRMGAYSGHTAGLASGYLQANLVILPKEFALDFMRFCQRNPKPCPLVGVSDTGNPMMHTLGRDIDIRTDVPAYSVYSNGRLESSVTDISDLWRGDFVVFALGCSFTFEHALQMAGISLWHITENKTVPMFRTNIPTQPAGLFSGNMVVSMRAIPTEKLDLTNEISGRYPLAHGTPIHIGNPAEIGITDLNQPDWGDAAPVEDGHVPVFWACGVTPQVAVEQAGLPTCITHKPGHMLITDVSESAETPIITNQPTGD
jgi:uncharacterized protein YcsI (UPF0317 family)